MPRSLVQVAALAVAAVAAAACGDNQDGPACTGDVLFGAPNANTGLTSAQCAPTCTCAGEAWSPPAYGPADVAALQAWELTDPPAELTANPYDGAAPPPPDPDAVCAVVVEDAAAHRYHLADFATEDAARAAGAVPTHFGGCGVCSTLTDLAVYMANPDLTQPVRQCGLDHLNDPPADHIQCLLDLGFTYPCAQIWYFNTIHTKDACAAPCFLALSQTYHEPDGTLNECLRCDEVESGPVFKAVAGRTRRNTGLASALCRPCSEVRPLVHAY